MVSGLSLASIPTTARSNYGGVFNSISPSGCANFTGPAGNCAEETFQASVDNQNGEPDWIYSYQIKGLSNFTLKIGSSDVTLENLGDAFGLFVADTSDSLNFYGPDLPNNATGSYACDNNTATSDCSVSSSFHGFNVSFTVRDDPANTSCSSTPGADGGTGCLVFFVVETDQCSPNVTLTPGSASTPEPASAGLLALGVAAIAGLGRKRLNPQR